MAEDESQEKKEVGRKRYKNIPVGVKTKQRFLHFKRQMEAKCNEEFSQDDIVIALLDIVESL